MFGRLCKYLLVCLILAVPAKAFATQISFLSKDIDLEGLSGPFLITKKNVNVRTEPASKSKRITKLDRRDIVTVLGKVPGKNWYAVKQNGQDLGYVFATSLTPLIDGKIDNPIEGKLDLSDRNKPDCSYKIDYLGRTSEEDIVFVSSDYTADFNCRLGFDMFRFSANLYMAEIPFDLGAKPVFQIALDFPEIATGYENFLSVTVAYNSAKNEVALEQVSLGKYKEKTSPKNIPVTSVEDALLSATKIQLQALNLLAWETIAGKVKPDEKEE